MSRILLAAMALLLVGLVGCSSGPVSPADDELATQRALWRSQAVSTYSYIYQPTCFCDPGPYRVSVAEGTVVRIEPLDPTAPDQPGGLVSDLTVEGLFTALERAHQHGPQVFSVSFDADLGFPNFAFVDFDLGVADEDGGFTVSEFLVALPGQVAGS